MSAPANDAQAVAAISSEMVRIHEESYGSGVKSVDTHLLDGMVISVLDIELLPAEKLLVETGQTALVRQIRAQFQEAVDVSFKAAVERATGRKVIAFLSETHVDPHFTVELFRLEPDGAGS